MDTCKSCPNCGKDTALNEMNAYGRCEDCYVGDYKGAGYCAQFVLRRVADERTGRRVVTPRAPY